MVRVGLGLVIALVVVVSCRGGDDVSGQERQAAIDAARDAYETAVAGEQMLDAGPCIAEELETVPGWSVDIAHEPRQDVDVDPANQCQLYREGKTEHFVELDPDGELIRAK